MSRVYGLRHGMSVRRALRSFTRGNAGDDGQDAAAAFRRACDSLGVRPVEASRGGDDSVEDDACDADSRRAGAHRRWSIWFRDGNAGVDTARS